MSSVSTILEKIRSQYRNPGKVSIVVPVVVLVVLVATSVLAWSQTKDFVNQQKEVEFNDAVNETTLRIEDALRDYVDILYGARGLFAASKDVERDEWQAFIDASDIQKRFTGIQALEFIPKITQKEKVNCVAQVRLDTSINPLGYPDFDIYPEGSRED